MVDSISSNLAAGLSVPASSPAPARPEPAVQVTATAHVQNGGDAARSQSDTSGRGGTPQGVADAFDEINSTMEAWNTGMRFEIDEDTQQLVVSVIDTNSGEVLRQIPSEEVLHVAKMIAQFQGNFVRTKA